MKSIHFLICTKYSFALYLFFLCAALATQILLVQAAEFALFIALIYLYK